MGKILISAGHTNVKGRDQGAAGNGFIEGGEAVKIRDSVASKLRLAGLDVLTDGKPGESKTLSEALKLAKTASTAIEIHFNASANPKATGVEVLAKSKHKTFAQRLAATIASALGLALRGERGYKSDSSGQHHRLVFCEVGGLIVEICFISNPNDMESYSANFDDLCENIALSCQFDSALKTTTSAKPKTRPMIQLGAKGDLVRDLQTALVEVGFMAKSQIDGDFGKKTEQALQRFQLQNGLTADGIAGKDTYKKLGLQ